MLRNVWVVTVVGCLAALLIVGGCPSNSGTSAGQTENSDTSGGDTSAAQLGGDEGVSAGEIRSLGDVPCGERAVTKAPASTFVELEYPTNDMEVLPADSTLAMAFFGPNPGADINAGSPTGASRTLWEVNQDGKVTTTYYLTEVSGKKTYWQSPASLGGTPLQFAVQDGCLTTTTAATEVDTAGLITSLQGGPCGTSALPVSVIGVGATTSDPNGLSSTTQPAAVQPSTQYICVELKIIEACVDCWYDGEGWHQRSAAKYRLTALGSLDAVQVAGVATNGGQSQTVDIHEGDSFDLAVTMIVVYKSSASPTELGYQERSTN